MLVFQSNSRMTYDSPARLTEETRTMLFTTPTASSMGLVMTSSTSAGAAPS